VQLVLSLFISPQDSHIQTDLTIARDKVIGVLLGIFAMGLIFDRYGAKSDAGRFETLLGRNVRMLAELVCSSLVHKSAGAVSEISRLRSQIHENFASLESQMDAVRFEFEFRHRRQQDADECQRIQRVQPWLRSMYLLQVSLLSHRGQREVGSGVTPSEKRGAGSFSKRV